MAWSEYSVPYNSQQLFNSFGENNIPYTAVPLIYQAQSEEFPAFFYPIFPNFFHNGPSNESPKVEERGFSYDSDNQVDHMSTSISTHENSSVTSLDTPEVLKLNESTCSGNSFQDVSNEGDDASNGCSGTPSNDSLETASDCMRRDSVYIGCNGYWYPLAHEMNAGSASKIDKTASSQFPNYANQERAAQIIPPSRLVMPKPLMQYYNCFQRLDLPSTALGRPQLINPFSTDGSISLQDLWVAHMKLLFRNFPHKWSLSAYSPSHHIDNSWNSFRDLAKVRFYCQHCMDGWTSMFGIVVFFYTWNNITSNGEIVYQISGQKCGRCKPNSFEVPLWYPEEAQKVITNLYYEIASRFYGLRTPQPIRTRRLGQPINHHNKSLCQGCSHGLCIPALKESTDNKVGEMPSDILPCPIYPPGYSDNLAFPVEVVYNPSPPPNTHFSAAPPISPVAVDQSFHNAIPPFQSVAIWYPCLSY